jgi:hypothetical protein
VLWWQVYRPPSERPFLPESERRDAPLSSPRHSYFQFRTHAEERQAELLARFGDQLVSIIKPVPLRPTAEQADLPFDYLPLQLKPPPRASGDTDPRQKAGR